MDDGEITAITSQSNSCLRNLVQAGLDPVASDFDYKV